MDYKEFDKTEIIAIAEEFENGVIVPAGMKTWYEYKTAVKHELHDIERFEKLFNDEDREFPPKIFEDVANRKQEAETEMAWINSIHTYDLHKVCEYIDLCYDHYNGHMELKLLPVMAQRILKGTTPEEEQMVRELLEETEYISTINTVRKLTRPISERTGKWSLAYNRPTEYYPSETRPMDATELYDHRTHYIYIESTNQATWGESYWISVDCQNTLYSLPVIKAFKEYDFEVGKFYKITCTDELRWGNNKRKYIMEIEESDKSEFMEKGFVTFATREFY